MPVTGLLPPPPALVVIGVLDMLIRTTMLRIALRTSLLRPVDISEATVVVGDGTLARLFAYLLDGPRTMNYAKGCDLVHWDEGMIMS